MVGVGQEQERILPVLKLLFLKVQFWALYYTFFQVGKSRARCKFQKKIIPANTNKKSVKGDVVYPDQLLPNWTELSHFGTAT